VAGDRLRSWSGRAGPAQGLERASGTACARRSGADGSTTPRSPPVAVLPLVVGGVLIAAPLGGRLMRWVAARGGNTRRPGVALALVSVRPFGRYFAAGSDGVANGPGRSKRGRDASRPPAAPPWPNATTLRVHSMRGSPAGGRVALAEQNRVAGSFRAGCVALVEQNVHPGSPTGGRVAVAEHFAGLAAASARDDGVGEQNRCRLPPECRDVRPRRRVSPGSPPECRDVRRRRRARRSSGPKPRDVRSCRRGEHRRTGRPRDVRPGRHGAHHTSAAPARRQQAERAHPPCYTPCVLDNRGRTPQRKQEEALPEEGATFAP
jgi:hypothetical protein